MVRAKPPIRFDMDQTKGAAFALGTPHGQIIGGSAACSTMPVARIDKEDIDHGHRRSERND